jgi:hypothetical protein
VEFVTVGHVYRHRETLLLWYVSQLEVNKVMLVSGDPAADAWADQEYKDGITFDELEENFQHIPGMGWHGEVSRGELITLTSRHGLFKCQPTALDLMMLRFTPASVDNLNEKIAELNGSPLDRRTSITSALITLAELTGYGL